jgi:uncharacterized protein (DUF58 family)
MLALGLAISSGPLIGLAAFILIAALVSKTWSEHVFDRLRFERWMPENRAFAGEKLQMTLRLVNDKFLPVPWIEMKDLVPEELPEGEEYLTPSGSPGQLYLTRSAHLSWYERISWPLQLDAPRRGYYRFGPTRFRSGDVFGFFPAEMEDEHYTGVTVYPTIYTLPELGLPAERPFGERKGRERIFEDPGRIAGIRDYRPEDSLRRIDWKASARMQALQSRVYEPSSTLHMLLAVNVHTLEHSWEGYVPETLERILSVAGSVARYGLEAGYSVGMVANGSYPTSDRPMRIPVGRRPEQLSRILEALAVIGPLTLTSLPVVVEREAMSFPFGATLVCVTSRMDEPLAAVLRRVRDGGHSVTVLSLSDQPFEEELRGVRFYDLSTVVRSLEARAGGVGGVEPKGAAVERVWQEIERGQRDDSSARRQGP